MKFNTLVVNVWYSLCLNIVHNSIYKKDLVIFSRFNAKLQHKILYILHSSVNIHICFLFILYSFLQVSFYVALSCSSM